MAASISSKSCTFRQQEICWNNFNLWLRNYFQRSQVIAGGIISANRLAGRVVHVAGYSAVKPHSLLNMVE